MVISSLSDLMARRLRARLVLPLSLSLAGALGSAQGQSPEGPLPVVLTQATGVSFQSSAAAITAGYYTGADLAPIASSILSQINGSTLSGGTLNIGYPTGTGASVLTMSGGTVRFGIDQVDFGSTSVVNFTGTILAGEPFSAGTIRLTPNRISPIVSSGLSLASLYNLQPDETVGGLVKTGAGTLQLSGSTGTVTALERPAIYPLDPSVAPPSLLTGGTLSLLQPTGSLVNAGSLRLTGNSTGSLLTLGGINPGTSILSGAIFDLATGTTILPTSGAILTVNGTANYQTFAGNNTLTINANALMGGTLRAVPEFGSDLTGGTLSAGTLLLRANSDPALTLNGQTVLSGTNLLSGGQTLSLITPVPEPGSAALLLGGALGLAALRRRRPQPERA